MGTNTKYLKLYKPAVNDYYNVEKDQNENFDKIDKAIEDIDKTKLNNKLDKGSYNGDAGELKRLIDGKENAFEKKSGFNKEKTSEYKVGKDAEKLFTQEGANSLYKEVEKNIRNIDLSGKTDKGGYSGTSKDLKNEIDEKQDKADISLKTDNKTVVGAINESLWKIIPKIINPDFNELKTEGFYRCGGTSQGALNAPSNDPTFTWVSKADDYIVQLNWGITGVAGFKKRNFIPHLSKWGEWEEFIFNDSKEFLGALGIAKIRFVQDNIEKIKDEGYIDKHTGKLYRAKVNTYDTDVTENFILATNIENSKAITSEDNIIKMHDGTMICYFKRSVNNGVYSLPKNFVNANFVIVGTIAQANAPLTDVIQVNPESSNTYRVRMFATINGNLTPAAREVNFIAIGKWK